VKVPAWTPLVLLHKGFQFVVTGRQQVDPKEMQHGEVVRHLPFPPAAVLTEPHHDTIIYPERRVKWLRWRSGTIP
jgi:hypothetical protein